MFDNDSRSVGAGSSNASSNRNNILQDASISDLNELRGEYRQGDNLAVTAISNFLNQTDSP